VAYSNCACCLAVAQAMVAKDEWTSVILLDDFLLMRTRKLNPTVHVMMLGPILHHTCSSAIGE